MKIFVNFKVITTLVLIILFTNLIYAKRGISPSVSLPETSNNLAIGAKFYCYSDIMNPFLGTTSTSDAFWPGPAQYASGIQAKINKYDFTSNIASIKLKIKEPNRFPGLCLPNSFSFTVNIRYKVLDINGVYSSEKTTQLSVNYNKNKGQNYKSIDVFKIENALLVSCNVKFYYNFK